MKTTLVWTIDDGYINRARHHQFKFDTDDYVESDDEWNALSDRAKKVLITEAAISQFENLVHIEILDYGNIINKQK